MSLRLGIRSERELYLLKEVAKGNIEFSELDPPSQLMLYESKVDVSQHVPEEQLREFERRYILNGRAGSRLGSAKLALENFLTRNFRLDE